MLNITDPGFTSVSICVICGYTLGFWTIWTVLDHKVTKAQRNPFLHFGQSLRHFGESLSLSLFCFLIFNFQLGSRIRGRHPCAECFRCRALALREAFRSFPSGTDGATTNHFGHIGHCCAEPSRYCGTISRTKSSRNCGTNPRVSKTQRTASFEICVHLCHLRIIPTFWTPVNLILDTHPRESLNITCFTFL